MSFLRAARRAAGRCSCGADLSGLINWPYRSCPECTESSAARQQRYRRRHRVRVNAAYRARRARTRDIENARERQRYLERKLAGICTECERPAADDSQLCVTHRDGHRAAARVWWRRSAERRAG